MRAPVLLVVNAGSSSVKFAVYSAGDEDTVRTGGVYPCTLGRADDAIDRIVDRLGAEALLGDLVAVGHRVVHGGPRFGGPTWITTETRNALEALVPLAPDHLPYALHAIDLIGRRCPGVPQLACFDTTFHRSMPTVARLFGLPHTFADAGVLRYGFHGLSYEYIAAELTRLGALGRRTIVAHLGSGASLVALRDGKSIDTTMGMTPAGGVVMGTRSGDLDPGVLLYLLRHDRLTPDALNRTVNETGGLAGLSGTSGDVVMLLELMPSDPRAAEAIDVFCYSVRKAIGAMAAALGGVDTLVFTAGIGEHSAQVRGRICEGLDWAGIQLDTARNDAHAAVISLPGAPVTVRVIATREDLVIARHVRALLAMPSSLSPSRSASGSGTS